MCLGSSKLPAGDSYVKESWTPVGPLSNRLLGIPNESLDVGDVALVLV